MFHPSACSVLRPAVRTLTFLVFILLAKSLLLPSADAQELRVSSPVEVQKPPLTAAEIAARLQEANRERELALRRFEGQRFYQVHYKGFFGARDGQAVVRCNYTSPSQKEFEVVSQTGSKLIFDHVIKGLLNAEKEAASEENRRRTSLTAANYEFTLADEEGARAPSEYVLNVIPKHNNKYLYRGKIWVDAKDFAVTRIEAEPAKNPSFWVKKTLVRHKYQKLGEFWLPAENHSESFIRMGGQAVLSIEYTDYKITESVPLGSGGVQAEKTSAASAPSTSDHPFRANP